MSRVKSDQNILVSVSCLYFVSWGYWVSECPRHFLSVHLSYFSHRLISSYFSVYVCVFVNVCKSKVDACQVLGRLISFVFQTVSSIYPSPVERGWGGEVSVVLLLWRAEPDTHGPIPTEAAFIIRPTCCIVQVITFSVAQIRGNRVSPESAQLEHTVWIGSSQLELIQNICSCSVRPVAAIWVSTEIQVGPWQCS